MLLTKPLISPQAPIFSSNPRKSPNHSPNSFALKPALTVRNSASQPVVSSPPTLAQTRVDILSESLPFIQRFRGKTIVVKYGGAAMTSPDLRSSVINDLVLLSCVGLRPVLVHGGGPEINSWLLRLGHQPLFHNGLRVTDAVTMDVVEIVLVGKVNKSLVSLINLAGSSAVGLCGKDARLVTARPSPDAASLGFVGDVAKVDPAILRPIIADGHIPVIASVAEDVNGQSYNVNADTAAGEIAAAIGAEKLILLTDVAGILEDRNDPGSLVREIDIAGARRMVNEGKVAGGDDPQGELLCPVARTGGEDGKHYRREGATLSAAGDTDG